MIWGWKESKYIINTANREGNFWQWLVKWPTLMTVPPANMSLKSSWNVYLLEMNSCSFIFLCVCDQVPMKQGRESSIVGLPFLRWLSLRQKDSKMTFWVLGFWVFLNCGGFHCLFVWFGLVLRSRMGRATWEEHVKLKKSLSPESNLSSHYQFKLCELMLYICGIKK